MKVSSTSLTTAVALLSLALLSRTLDAQILYGGLVGNVTDAE